MNFVNKCNFIVCSCINISLAGKKWTSCDQEKQPQTKRTHINISVHIDNANRTKEWLNAISQSPSNNTLESCMFFCNLVFYDTLKKKPFDIWKAVKLEKCCSKHWLYLSRHFPHDGSMHKQSCQTARSVTEEEEWRTQCTARLTRVVSP